MNLNFTGLSKAYGGRTIFHNLRGQIDSQDKVGLIGANGVGKTTLVNILAGKEVSDEGEIRYSPSYTKILFIEQYPEFDKNISVYEDIFKYLIEDKKL